jgi:hypothetical protein
MALWFWGNRKRRPFYLLAVVAIGGTTLLTIGSRPGLGEFLPATMIVVQSNSFTPRT